MRQNLNVVILVQLGQQLIDLHKGHGMFVPGNIAAEVGRVATDADRLIRSDGPAFGTIAASQEGATVGHLACQHKLTATADVQASVIK